MFFQRLSKYKDAVKDLDALLKLDPSNADAIRERELLSQLQVGVTMGVVTLFTSACRKMMEVMPRLIYDDKFLKIKFVYTFIFVELHTIQDYTIQVKSYLSSKKSVFSTVDLSIFYFAQLLKKLTNRMI